MVKQCFDIDRRVDKLETLIGIHTTILVYLVVGVVILFLFA